MSKCNLCFSKNQRERHYHFLAMPDLFMLSGHLKEQYKDDEEKDQGQNRGKGRGTVDGILAWVRTMQFIYGNRIGEDGVRVSVADAWAQGLPAHQQIAPKGAA